MVPEQEDVASVLRLLAVLLIVAILVVIATTRVVPLPFIGALPGDLRITLPGVHLYLPLTSSVLIGLLLTALVAVIHGFSNNND